MICRRHLGRGPEPSLLYRWTGLDGSWVPLMADQNGFGVHIDRREPATLQRDSCFVFVKAPDLQEFDVDRDVAYVALDEALQRQRNACEPVVEAKLQVPWSYVEGTDADTHLLALARAEINLLQYESLASLVGDDSPIGDPDDLWKRWLYAQHHDGLWHGAPELRAKQRDWCREVATTARAAVRALPLFGPPGDVDVLELASIYPLPQQGVLRLTHAGPAPTAVVTDEGEWPVQTIDSDGERSDVLVPFVTHGCTSAGLRVAGTAAAKPDPAPLASEFTYENAFYHADVSAYGGLLRVRHPNGRELFRNTGANHKDFTVEGLRRQAAMGLTHHRILGMGWTELDETRYRYGLDAAGALTAMVDGRLHAFALCEYRSTVTRGPVADIVESAGSVGPIPVTRRTYLYHRLPWVEIEVTCAFDETTIDAYTEDAHKLCIWWPYWYRDLLTTGIPGGADVPSRPEIAFLPANWFDLDHMWGGSDHNFLVAGGGMGICSEHAHKTFRRNNRIGTVLAWGDDQGHFSNHNMALKWRTNLDLRLRGARTSRFYLYPHLGSWASAGVPRWAMALQRPPVAAFARRREGWRRDLLAIAAPGIVPTSVRRDGGLRIRFYEGVGAQTQVDKVEREGGEVRWSRKTGQEVKVYSRP